MQYQTAVLYLEQIPKIVVDAGFDLATFLSFLVTIIIFLIGTWVTIRNANQKSSEQLQIMTQTLAAQKTSLDLTIESQKETLAITVASQKEIARSTAVKVSRQAWIDELRQCCSLYMAQLYILNGHSQTQQAYEELGHSLSKNNFGQAGAELVVAYTTKLIELRSQLFELRYRIELLANPKEDLFKRLIQAVVATLSIAESATSAQMLAACDEIKQAVQEILKIEWDRTKAML